MSDITHCPGRTDGAYEIAAECRDCLRRTPPKRPGPVSWMVPQEEPCVARLEKEDAQFIVCAHPYNFVGQ